MSDSTINVSGSDQAYAIDAIRLGDGTGDYRQVVCVGDFTNSGITGSVATIAASALHVSSVGEKQNSNTMSYASFALSGAAGSPVDNQELIAAPGANKALLIHGYQTCLGGIGGTSEGVAMLTGGNDTGTNRFYLSQVMAEISVDHSIMLKYPIQIDTNTAVKITTTEIASHTVFAGVVYYTTIPV